MVFKQLMQVLTASPFSYLHEPFQFGKISEDQWSGEGKEGGRVRAGLVWHLLNPSATQVRGAENICQGGTRKIWSSWLVCGAPDPLFRGERGTVGAGMEDLPGELCTDHSHYV